MDLTQQQIDIKKAINMVYEREKKYYGDFIRSEKPVINGLFICSPSEAAKKTYFKQVNEE